MLRREHRHHHSPDLTKAVQEEGATVLRQRQYRDEALGDAREPIAEEQAQIAKDTSRSRRRLGPRREQVPSSIPEPRRVCGDHLQLVGQGSSAEKPDGVQDVPLEGARNTRPAVDSLEPLQIEEEEKGRRRQMLLGSVVHGVTLPDARADVTDFWSLTRRVQCVTRKASAGEKPGKVPHMSKRIQTSIGVNYLRAGWDKSALIREVLSNAQDAHLMHDAEMEVSHKGATLTVVTRGATLARRNMLLGGGNKFGRSDTIGQFEEGLKLALLVAARDNIPCKITTGAEIWKPVIASSAAFDGEEVLTIVVSDTKEYFDGVRVEVGKISAKEWEIEKKKYLFLLDNEAIGRVKPSEGASAHVLTARAQKGRIYVKGVFVQTMQDAAYGYDLLEVKVDRDRKMVDDWDAKYAMSAALVSMSAKDKGVAKTLYTQAKLGHSDGSGYSVAYAENEALDAICEAFDEEYGAGAVACTDAKEVERLRNLGKPAAVVPARLREAIEKKRGRAAVVIGNLLKQPTAIVKRNDLTAFEAQNLDMAVEVLADAGYTLAVDVVEFPEEKVLGQIDMVTGMILVSRKVLSNVRKVVATLIHEVAHRESCAGDGSSAHTDAIEQIWEKVWAKAFGV